MRLIKFLILAFGLFIILTLAFQAQAQTQKKSVEGINVNRIIDSVTLKAKAIGLNSSQIGWDSIRSKMYEKAEFAKSVNEMKKSFEYLLTALKDEHGQFSDPATKTRIAAYPQVAEESLLADQPAFHFELLKHNIRYIRVIAPASGGDLQKQAQQLRDAVDSLMHGKDSLQWIVDLRYCGGGDMKTLFAGLAPLLDEGLVASTLDNKNKIRDMYTVHNGNFYVNQVRVGKFSLHKTDLRNAKVAVLTSRYTSGAAEVFSIGLKGKKHTKFFGEPTAGQIFGATTVDVAKILTMQLSSTIYVNKKGIEYRHPLTPDTHIDFTMPADVKHDKAIEEASLWLTASHVTEPATKVASN